MCKNNIGQRNITGQGFGKKVQCKAQGSQGADKIGLMYETKADHAVSSFLSLTNIKRRQN